MADLLEPVVRPSLVSSQYHHNTHVTLFTT
ncbi:uncharacterized protein G2W53_030953 [Senna tora]|uniref:Uncharacterized protein n=1 Tax=Senna tora TaxID=362788 RepID=A0A834T7F0_9FABA|nr:uncharacterized protein G2W53_030953 [Senna tora]